MTVVRSLDAAITYLFEAAARIFGPSDDAYPLIGLQPYEGDPYGDPGRGWKDA